MENANIKPAGGTVGADFAKCKARQKEPLEHDFACCDMLVCRDILAPLVFLVKINWAIKKAYTEQHYYALFVHIFLVSSPLSVD